MFQCTMILLVICSALYVVYLYVYFQCQSMQLFYVYVSFICTLSENDKIKLFNHHNQPPLECCYVCGILYTDLSDPFQFLHKILGKTTGE